jgi:hypothetical protein
MPRMACFSLCEPTNRYNGTYQKATQEAPVSTGGRPLLTMYGIYVPVQYGTAGYSRGYQRCLRLDSRTTKLGVGRAVTHGLFENSSSFDLREYQSNTAKYMATFCGWP